MYSTWQAFNQALLVDSPLLSYIHIRHTNFLPSKFIAGEARDIGPQYICSNERELVRDELAERMSRAPRERAQKQIQPEAPPQPEALVGPEAPI